MSIIDALGSIHKHAVRTACSGEGGCIFGLNGFHKYIILKGEPLCKEPIEMCDYLVFVNETAEELLIAVIEFKTNNLHVNKVARQIENGSLKASSIINNCKEICLEEELDCLGKKKLCLIAVARRWDANTRKMLRSKKVIADGRPHYIHAKECGDLLKDVRI